MTKTKIEWATDVWNPTVGCTKVSSGCKNCYAERIFNRFHRWPVYPAYEKFSEVKCHPERIDQPFHWKQPRRVFVDSMSDLFHEDVPLKFIQQVFTVMISADWHTFMVLTKRPKRMHEIINQYPAYKTDNIWLGVSVEDQKTADERIPWLLKTPAAVRFVSVEPMLGKINLAPYIPCAPGQGFRAARGALLPGRNERPDIDWVICGGESGPSARPMQPEWAEDLLSQCLAAKVPFFFKQWGEWSPGSIVNGKPTMTRIGKKRAGRTLCGRTWDKYPENNTKS